MKWSVSPLCLSMHVMIVCNVCTVCMYVLSLLKGAGGGDALLAGPGFGGREGFGRLYGMYATLCPVWLYCHVCHVCIDVRMYVCQCLYVRFFDVNGMRARRMRVVITAA